MSNSKSELPGEYGNPFSANEFIISFRLAVAAVAAAMAVVYLWLYPAGHP
jgi:hypothetical protein